MIGEFARKNGKARRKARHACSEVSEPSSLCLSVWRTDANADDDGRWALVQDYKALLSSVLEALENGEEQRRRKDSFEEEIIS